MMGVVDRRRARRRRERRAVERQLENEYCLRVESRHRLIAVCRVCDKMLSPPCGEPIEHNTILLCSMACAAKYAEKNYIAVRVRPFIREVNRLREWRGRVQEENTRV
jgi:hypothetical protein